MAASEIDAIFAGKASLSKLPREPASSSHSTLPDLTQQKKRKKKRKESESARTSKTDGLADGSEKKKRSKSTPDESRRDMKNSDKTRKIAETVLDPSRVIESNASSKARRPPLKLSEADEDFRDTRGKNRKRTEDGYAIYTAEELKINDESGGTPLCPFDCDCCH